MTHIIQATTHETNSSHGNTQTESIFLERSFWLRVWGYAKEDLLALYRGINVIFAVLLGVFLFLLDFPLVKEFLIFIIAIPISIYLAVKYLTLIPTIFFLIFLAMEPKYAVISLSIISVFSFIWVLLV